MEFWKKKSYLQKTEKRNRENQIVEYIQMRQRMDLAFSILRGLSVSLIPFCWKVAQQVSYFSLNFALSCETSNYRVKNGYTLWMIITPLFIHI